MYEEIGKRFHISVELLGWVLARPDVLAQPALIRSTEDLREAMVRYRELFEDLLQTGVKQQKEVVHG